MTHKFDIGAQLQTGKLARTKTRSTAIAKKADHTA